MDLVLNIKQALYHFLGYIQPLIRGLTHGGEKIV